MPEPFSAEDLNILRQRWERDPKSRAFLQLAEEYRRAGRLPDAVHVLQAGLKEHPTYLAAQVALGRCLVESGEPQAAVAILERAVARDPTQLVANKLLVEAYLAEGEAAKARERLDLYKLFNDRDAEIEPLERRIHALESPAPAALAAPAPRANPVAPAAESVALFALPAIDALPEVELAPVYAPRLATGDASQREPFGRLWAPGAAQRIDTEFARQGIFPLAPPVAALEAAPAEAPVAAVVPREWESEAWPDGAAAAEEPPQEPAAVPLALVEEAAELPVVPYDWVPEAPAAPSLPVSASPKAASATLGELYLAQGHLDEAEESFQSVLQARPGDPAALAGLESVRLQRGDESAAFADEPPAAEESHVIVGGLTARKAALLKDYLARIRRGAQRHVS